MGTTIINTSITVPYEEMDGSPRETYASDGTFQATRTLRCDWDDRETIIKQFLGDCIATDTDILIYRAHQYPGNSLATANNVSNVQGVGRIQAGDDLTVAAYEKAQFDVNYVQNRNANSDNPDPEIYSESFRPTAKFESIGKTSQYYLNGKKATVKDGLPLIEIGAEWNITRKKLSHIPLSFLTNMGKVNSDTVTSAWFGLSFTPGTLLWQPIDVTREVLRSGQGLWTVTLKWAYMQDGWNSFWVEYIDTKSPERSGITTAGISKLLKYDGETPVDGYLTTTFNDAYQLIQGPASNG